jgi:hypothetical protein
LEWVRRRNNRKEREGLNGQNSDDECLLDAYLDQTRITALVELAKATDKADVALFNSLIRIGATDNTGNLE